MSATNIAAPTALPHHNIRLMTNDEFYQYLDHCIQCQCQCSKDELLSYLGVCATCHFNDIFEVYDDDNYNSDSDSDDGGSDNASDDGIGADWEYNERIATVSGG